MGTEQVASTRTALSLLPAHACGICSPLGAPPMALQSIFKKLSAGPSKPPPRMSIESGPFTFHYLIEGGVCYLTLTDKGYPKKLAFQYLEELQSEFSRLYGTQIDSVTRPYAFIKFGEWGSDTREASVEECCAPGQQGRAGVLARVVQLVGEVERAEGMQRGGTISLHSGRVWSRQDGQEVLTSCSRTSVFGDAFALDGRQGAAKGFRARAQQWRYLVP